MLRSLDQSIHQDKKFLCAMMLHLMVKQESHNRLFELDHFSNQLLLKSNEFDETALIYHRVDR